MTLELQAVVVGAVVGAVVGDMELMVLQCKGGRGHRAGWQCWRWYFTCCCFCLSAIRILDAMTCI